MAVFDNTETRAGKHWHEIAREARLAAGKGADEPLGALWFSDEMSNLVYRLHGLCAALGGLRPFSGDEKLRQGVGQLLDDVLQRAETLTDIFEAERQLAIKQGE